jgi:predicted ABC-type ATPase
MAKVKVDRFAWDRHDVTVYTADQTRSSEHATLEAFHPGHPSQKVHGRRGRRHLPTVGGLERYTRGIGTKDDPIVTNDAWAAADALADGKHVQLDSPEEVSTLLDRLHEIGVEAKAAGTKAKLYDLCKVSVAHTNLFCAESKGVARVNMPQFRGHPRPGTPADKMDKLPDGKVDLSRPFIDHLQAGGVKVADARVDAAHLKASQRELDGVKVAGMMKAMQSGKLRVRDAFFVSSDNYVVDGHHLWAATVGREFSEGKTLYLDVQRIDAPILDVLDQANTFTADQGLPRAGITAALVARLQERTPVTVDDATAQQLYVTAARGHPQPPDLTPEEARFFAAAAADLEQFHLPGGHNQKKHGRKIPGDGARARMGDIPLDEGFLKDFHGGSAMAHLTKGPDGTYRFTPERQALHDEIINRHLTGKTPTEGQPVYHVLGGGPAAGKSHYVASDAGVGLRDANTVMVNADDMKAELPEYQQMTADRNPTAASFVHEESSYLAARLQAASFENRLNVTLDGTGDSTPAKLRSKLATAKAAGYRVEGHYVTVPTDVAVQRANTRGAKTGRYVPESVVRGTHSGVSRALPEVYPEFDAVDLYDTRGSDLEHVMEWRDGSFTVHDSGLWDEFVAKGAT